MKYDITVIGSGPGGYVGAIRAAQLGYKVAIIEKYNTLGGTCLNVGCIPSKALLDSSEHYHNATHTFKEHGIKTGAVSVDMKQMIKRKNDVVTKITGGVEYLMKKNKIDVFHGHGSFVTANKIKITKADGSSEELESDKVIIATGSKPITPAAFNYDKKRVITSTEALNIDKVPKKVIVIGAGVIGLELGSVFSRLGSEVEVIEFQDKILGAMDKDASRELQRALKKSGFKFHLNHMVTDVKASKTGVTVSYQKRDTEDVLTMKADYCLVAIGRRAYTDNLVLENIGLATDDRGRVDVNDHLETNIPNVYAIGDVVRGAMLAHKAEEEGVYVAEYIAGQKPHINHNLIPGVVYTWPEVSSVGKTEEELKTEGVPYNSGKFPFKALGRAQASMDVSGMAKVLSHKETDEILGVHIVGARAADMIMEAVSLMEFRASAEDMARICHPHPTYTEALKEAALGATGNRMRNM